jgi:uncharacterized protein YggU (UPF0235/DUF167 family)
VRVSVTVKPGSKQPGIEETDGALVVRVRERAIEGNATAACIRALAQHFAVAPTRVTLVQGVRSRHKVFDIDR